MEYTPGSNPVQDGSGLDALPVTGEEVANTTPPIPARAEVPPRREYASPSPSPGDLDIAADRLPPPGAFTVKADDGDTATVVTVESVALGADPDQS